MNVSIIIINFNTKDLILACVESIIRQTSGLTYEIIVVDNASIDGSARALSEQFPQTILIESNENIGFGSANNLGAEIAKGKYLFFLNSDTILLNNSILVLFHFSESNFTKLKVGITGGILLDEHKLETASFGPLPSKTNLIKSILGFLPRFTKMNSNEIKFFQTNGYLEVGYIMGADMFISKSDFKKIGGFDLNIFMYYEETDLQLRLKNAGYHNYIIAGTQIIHFEGLSFNQAGANNNKRMLVTKSMFYFFRKHSKYLSYLIFKIVFLIIRLATVVDFRYSWKEKKNYISQIIKS